MFRRIITIVLAIGLTFTLLCVPALGETSTEVTPSPQTVTTFGRTYYQNGVLSFNWSNAGFTFTFVGRSVSANMSAYNGVSAGTFINVYVDNREPVTIELANRNNTTVVLAEDLDYTKHTVRVVKRSENLWGGVVSVRKLLIDGVLGTPPANATRKIEVIGDSITCGYGNTVTPSTAAGGYHSKEEDGTNTYATLAASYFGADCSVVARSGIGFSCDSGGNKNLLMGQVYGYTDYLSGGGASSPQWDFAANPSDVVILALGTNDTANSDSVDYENKAREMLALVREKNPNAHIIWAYGMMTDSRSNILQQIVKDANNAGDSKVYYHALTHMGSIENGIGGGNHPGMATHIYNSKQLAATIAQVTGWKTVTPVTADVTAEPYLLYDGESLDNVSGAFSTGVSLDTNHTQGNTSLKMDYTVATGLQNKIGGMAFIKFPESVDLSAAQSISFDLYVSADMTNSNGLQVNFATVNQDGFNVLLGLDNKTTGWHTFTITPKSVAAVNNTADWSKINTIRITWMNYAQLGPRYFLLDNMQVVTNATAQQLPYEQPAVVPDADLEAANNVIAMIEALTGENGTAEAEARAAYEALTPLQQALVTNLARLEEMEAIPNTPDDPLPPVEDISYGDVNGDGGVDAKDALLILQGAVGKAQLNGEQITAADVNGDQAIDAKDALLVLQRAVNKIQKFPVEE